jgi:hypothetical protein
MILISLLSAWFMVTLISLDVNILKKPQPMNYPAASSGVSQTFKFCHSALDAESSPVFWIPALVPFRVSAGMTNSPQAAGNTTRRDLTG